MENGKQIKAIRRESKYRPKMAVHGRGVKTRKSAGILKYARRKAGPAVVSLCALAFLSWTPAVSAQSASPPRLSIISPAPGEVVPGKDVKVILELPAGVTLEQNHVHLWLDTLPTHSNELGILLEKTLEYTYADVFSGLHTLYAEAQRNDHQPLAPKLTAEVEFEVVGAELKPAVKNLGPGEQSSENAGGLGLARGTQNTAFALILIVVVVGLLWYTVGRADKKT